MFSAFMPMPGCAVASVFTTSPWSGGADTGTPRAVISRFVDLLYRQRMVRAAFESCVIGAGYRDHVVGGFRGRSQAIRELSRKLGEGGISVLVQHLAIDNDIGMVHLAVRRTADAEPEHRVEIFRVANGRIVEHWGVADPTANIQDTP